MDSRFLNGSRPPSLEIRLGIDETSKKPGVDALQNGKLLRGEVEKHIDGNPTSLNDNYKLHVLVSSASLQKTSSISRSYSPIQETDQFDLILSPEDLDLLRTQGEVSQKLMYRFNGEDKTIRVKVAQ